MFAAITSFLPLIDKIVERIPDPAMRERAALDMQAELLKAAASESSGQAEINKIEAGSSDPFVSRWRPAIGWICVFGLGFQYIVIPIVTWIGALTGYAIPLPPFDTQSLYSLTMGMLGMGALRTFEKWKGVAK
jgi:hypothetical protein